MSRSEKNTVAAPERTVITSIVGPCGRFMLPLEPETVSAFYRACREAGAEASEVIATGVHAAILATITRANAGRRK